MAPNEVEQFPQSALYDTSVLRTVFLEFDSDEWEQELEAFKDTDVEVPATVTVDGQVYPNVGVHFRGMSSYMMVPRGKKRSLNLSFDFIDDDQRLYGYKTLNLLNCAGDASMMSAVLYAHVGNQYIPTPKANFVEVVINGESWGVYANVQQFDKVFLAEHFEPAKGTRWKVPGSPGGDGGLRYLGDELDEYKARFDMKSNDDEARWSALIELCRVLNETPAARLEAELEKVLDIDEALKFLALDVALVNSDGYWTRASDYNLYCSADGVFQLVPHDTNEAFSSGHGGPPGGGRDANGGRRRGRDRSADRANPELPPGFPPPGAAPPDFLPPGEGPGVAGGPPAGFRPPFGFGPPGGGPRGGGPGGFGHGGVDLDPLVGLDSERMPLRSRLLAIPKLREKYLGYVRQIAEESLDWTALESFVQSQHELIDQAVQQDTRKLASYEQFEKSVGELQDFAEKRREYLLDYQPSSDNNE